MRLALLKYLSFAYWELTQFFKAIYDDGFDEFKAMTIIGCTEICIVMALVGCLSLLIGHRVLVASWWTGRLFIIVVAVILFASNYVLLAQGKTVPI